MILAGKLRPGEKLAERDLGASLKVSRTPIREALGRLVQDGLVEYRPQRGHFVRAIDMRSVEDLYSLREMLEVYAIRLAMSRMQRTDFAVSVDASAGISTGVSAYDRFVTIKLLADPDAQAEQLVQPGHVFPLRAKPGGVLERAGHTEAAVDLALLAGLPPAGVLCELVNDDGTMQRMPELVEFRKRFGLKMISVEQLIAYRLRRESLIRKVAENDLPTPYGTFRVHVFQSRIDRRTHLALTLGLPAAAKPVLVRVHTANVLTDVFHVRGSADGRTVLDTSLRAIAADGCGAVLYMQPANSEETLLKQVSPGQTPGDAPPAMDLRDYGIGAQILRELGLTKVRLLTQHPRKVVGLDGYGVELVEQIDLAKLAATRS